MHVLLAIDGSQQSLAAAELLHKLANPTTVERVTILTVTDPQRETDVWRLSIGVTSGQSSLDQLHGREHDAQGRPLYEGTRDGADDSEIAIERERALAEEALQVLTTARSLLSGLTTEIQSLACSGGPAKGILHVAKDQQVDLIVIGSDTQNRLQAILHSGIAEQVLHQAHRPVLIVQH
jgi:nucleotide-binding universal stress UspA family protein